MKCRVSKYGKQGVWSSFLKDFFWKIFKNKDFGLNIFKKGQILMPFSSLALSKLNIFSKKVRVGYVFIEESIDNIFNMDYGSGKSPIDHFFR